jgi:hypothetical protein
MLKIGQLKLKYVPSENAPYDPKSYIGNAKRLLEREENLRTENERVECETE